MHIHLFDPAQLNVVVQFDVAERYASLGSALTIDLPVVEKAGTNFQLKIDYETTEKCTAVQFLKPEYVIQTKLHASTIHY